MTDFACRMISSTYDPVAKRFISFGEITPIDFIGLSPRRGPKRTGREIGRRIRARAAEVPRLRGSSHSEMAPQTVDIARNGLAMAIRRLETRVAPSDQVNFASLDAVLRQQTCVAIGR
jgi:hypothetical protein